MPFRLFLLNLSFLRAVGGGGGGGDQGCSGGEGEGVGGGGALPHLHVEVLQQLLGGLAVDVGVRVGAPHGEPVEQLEVGRDTGVDQALCGDVVGRGGAPFSENASARASAASASAAS